MQIQSALRGSSVSLDTNLIKSVRGKSLMGALGSDGTKGTMGVMV